MNMARIKFELETELREIIILIDKFLENEFSSRTRSELRDKVENLHSYIIDPRLIMRWMPEPGEPCKRCNGTGIEPL